MRQNAFVAEPRIPLARADPGFWFGGARSSAQGARIEAPQAPNGGSAPSPENFLTLGSQNAYFGAFCGPSEADSV